MSKNILFSTDGYKPSHFLQDPPGTRGKFSYIVARKGGGVLWFGLQAIIKEYLTTPVTMAMVNEASEFYSSYGVPFNKQGWVKIVEQYGGLMPVRIRALPEGVFVPAGVALATVETPDDPDLAWVGGWLETLLLRVWYPTTVATRSFQCKGEIMQSMLATCDNLDGLDFKLHDFGARGVSSGESAALGGMAHLVNFKGSDTIEGILAAERFYPNIGSCTSQRAGFSIPAAEHSTITAWGRDHEVDAYRNMLTQFAKPGAVLAVVSDSYDIDYACDQLWGVDLCQQVIDSGATVVIRPDSGDATEVLPRIARILAKRFGTTTNSKGYKLLNNVRLIQGDGIGGPADIDVILFALSNAGFSADNIAFGMGGGLLQQLDRDTHGFAMKCSAVNINGAWHDAYKDPVTDPGKASLRGRLKTVYDCSSFKTVRDDGWADRQVNAMMTVYDMGEMTTEFTLGEIRESAHREAEKLFLR